MMNGLGMFGYYIISLYIYYMVLIGTDVTPKSLQRNRFYHCMSRQLGNQLDETLDQTSWDEKHMNLPSPNRSMEVEITPCL